VGNARAIDQTQPPWWNVVDVTPERLAMVTEKPVAMLGDQLGASFFYGEFATFPCHGGRGTTYLFADGHVRWMTPAEFVFSPTGSWGLMAIDVSVAVLD
jgi:prepilin-type processing-associated H-X9-DG protein